MSTEELVSEIKKINEQLTEIQKALEKRELEKTNYSIVTIFAGFIPVFLFLTSYFQANPRYSIEYFTTLAFFIFFAGVSFIWAIIQIAKAKTPFTYSLTLILPLFVIFLPLLWSVLITFHMLSVTPLCEQLAIVVIGIYAAVFFAYFVIELLYRKLIVRTKS